MKSFSFILIVVLLVLQFSRVAYSDSRVPGLSPLNPAFLDYIDRYAETQGQMSALIPSPMPPEIHKPHYRRKAMSSLATRYDMRDPNGDGDQGDSLLPPVRNQESHHACWVFGAYGSLESHIKKSFGVEEDFSENHLQHAHGFDFEAEEGGSIFVAAAYFSRYDGPISESDDPYYSQDYCTDCSPVRYIDGVVYLPARSDVDDNNYIKEAVLEYGGVFSSMLFVFKDSHYDHEGCVYYYDKDEGPPNNHDVAIVGWDDEKEVQGAPGPGAFIVRNSWGTKGSWSGDSGYFYVSYYDKRIGFTSLACFDEKDDADFEFDRVLYYDRFGLTAGFGLETDVAWGANRFKPDKDGRLTGVGFFVTRSNMSYEIHLFGKSIFVQSGQVAYSGWHTVKLERALAIKKGVSFRIAVRFHTPDFNHPVPIEDPMENYCSQATANPGESYVSANGFVWKDLTELVENANVCIKAFCAEVIEGDIDNSGAVDLTDAIAGLQLCSGITPSAEVEVSTEADVSGDGKIGMEEVIYVLQKCAGLR